MLQQGDGGRGGPMQIVEDDAWSVASPCDPGLEGEAVNRLGVRGAASPMTGTHQARWPLNGRSVSA